MPPPAETALPSGNMMSAGVPQLLGTLLQSGSIAGLGAQLLPMLVPWYGTVNELFQDHLGIDITKYVTSLFFLVAFGKAVLYAWNPVAHWLSEKFTCHVTLSEGDRVYEDVMEWVSNNVTDKASWYSYGARSLYACAAKTWDRSDLSADMGGPVIHNDTSPSIRYDPAIATRTRFFYNWHLITLLAERDKDDHRSKYTAGNTSNRSAHQIVLSCIGLWTAPLKTFLEGCRKSALNSKSSMTAFHKVEVGISGDPTARGWSPATLRPTRPLATVDMDEEQKQELVKDIHKYLRPAASRFYARRGIPYRRGFLFYGPPGTGKTSMSLALAGAFQLELYILNLNEFEGGDHGLADLFTYLPRKCIVLLEDIDSAGVEREDLRHGSKKGRNRKTNSQDQESNRKFVTLSGLLNAIDGVSSQEGRVLIMTSNTPETLDAALIRPGRIDRQVFFGPVSKSTAEKIFLRMYTKDPEDFETVEERNQAMSPNLLGLKIDEGYDPPLTPRTLMKQFSEKTDEKELRRLAKVFASHIPEDKLTPAEVQGYLLWKAEDPYAALVEVSDWAEKTLESKEQGKNVIQSTGGQRSAVNHSSDESGSSKGRPRRLPPMRGGRIMDVGGKPTMVYPSVPSPILARMG